jgi:hypothetical protein
MGVVILVWLLMSAYAVCVAGYIVCRGLHWLFVRVILDIPQRKLTYHKMVVTDQEEAVSGTTHPTYR